MGINRSTIANTIRLLNLPSAIRDLVDSGKIAAGHARAVLMVKDQKQQIAFARRIEQEKISVRDAERIASKLKSAPRRQIPVALDDSYDTVDDISDNNNSSGDIDELARQILTILGTKVNVRGDTQKGVIEISYYSLEDLERIADIIISPHIDS